MGLLFHETVLQLLQMLKACLSQNRSDAPLLVRLYRIIVSRTGNQLYIPVKTAVKLNHLLDFLTERHIRKQLF